MASGMSSWAFLERREKCRFGLFLLDEGTVVVRE